MQTLITISLTHVAPVQTPLEESFSQEYKKTFGVCYAGVRKEEAQVHSRREEAKPFVFSAEHFVLE